MKSGARLQPGHLLTSEERRILRDLGRDLEKRIHAGAGDIGVLERQLGSVQRERDADRDARRRLPRKQKDKRKRGGR